MPQEHPNKGVSYRFRRRLMSSSAVENLLEKRERLSQSFVASKDC